MNSEMTKRLMWSGLLAAVGAIASLAAHKAAVLIWERVFDEQPPEG